MDFGDYFEDQRVVKMVILNTADTKVSAMNQELTAARLLRHIKR
jgi:predicted GIY-YIG superfamily endonuclease